jgi:molybdopterin-containing oxidoreductase family membrane subunit
VSAVYALYSTPDAAQRAVNGLRAAGIGDDRITILSSEPFEEHEFAHRDKATWMGWIAVAGGVTGLAFAAWLTRMTELAWPLKTGNMPIVAWWPNLIVMFELTMLGGILAAVVTLLVTAGLPSRRPALYDPEIMDGRILVGVDNPADAAVVERALDVPGARIKRRP